MDIFIYIILGLFSGIIGGMGMGGGTFLIPTLSIFTDVDQKNAQGVNLFSFIPMSIIALVIHIRNKLVRFDKLYLIVIPALIFAALGSFFAISMSEFFLKKFFGIFLIALSMSCLFKKIK